jgi:hypothetical protein
MSQVGVHDPHLERVLHAALALRGQAVSDSGGLCDAEVPVAERQPEATAARDLLPRRASASARRRAGNAASRS